MNLLCKVFIPMMTLIFFASCATQIQNATTETVKVYGNCSMCASTIEKAAAVKGVSLANWNKDTKMADLRFDVKKINAEEILKRIALAGYDSEYFNAPNDAYAALPSCCQYDRPRATGLPIPIDNMGVVDEMTEEVPVMDTSGTVKEAKDMPMQEPKIEEVVEVPPMPKTTVPKQTTETAPRPKPAPKTVVTPQATTDNGKIQVEKILTSYYSLKNALVADDANKANMSAKEMVSVMGKVDMAKFNKTQQDMYMPLAQKIKVDAGRVAETKEIARQRSYFNSLSKNVFTLIKSLQINTAPAYQQFCPMANDGKGAFWISNEKVVKNPYYGKSMLSCGKVSETLSGNK